LKAFSKGDFLVCLLQGITLARCLAKQAEFLCLKKTVILFLCIGRSVVNNFVHRHNLHLFINAIHNGKKKKNYLRAIRLHEKAGRALPPSCKDGNSDPGNCPLTREQSFQVGTRSADFFYSPKLLLLRGTIDLCGLVDHCGPIIFTVQPVFTVPPIFTTLTTLMALSSLFSFDQSLQSNQFL
jgi:hypothetical protein